MAELEHNASEPEVVYHYTTMDTMMKMVEGASIWATSIKFLNDVSEGNHYIDLIRERLPIYRQTRQLEDESIFDEVLHSSKVRPGLRSFVASFSRDADSLPQWRSYCANGNGVAIGFRVECLRRAFLKPESDDQAQRPSRIKPTITFQAIDYVDVSHVESLDEDIEKLVSLTLEVRNSLKTPTVETGVSVFFRLVLERMAYFKKHPSFSNEREYRLLVDHVFNDSTHVEFCPTRSTLRPYISLNIPRRHSGHEGLPRPPFDLRSVLSGRWDFIDRVVVGPTANIDLSVESVDAFFLKNHMYVQVRPSQIPFRDW
ncbi:DUF2971 domain-containing protein [Granulicella sp. dw_53]|uniref:DUF2971 domain-containing protein n=1 Tax=Granulicella sp. dw_53 TaxID=2719792 RepID=UPI001BD3F84E|nr:DUF2971 domain-containing protein [Granulicella sp. dw_53]